MPKRGIKPQTGHRLAPITIRMRTFVFQWFAGPNFLKMLSGLTSEPQTADPGKTRLNASDAFVFSLKAACSAVVALLCFDLFHLPGAIWAPVSAVIVTQPKLHSSFKASLLRVAANLVGAVVGAVATACTGHELLALAVGVLATGLVCHFAKLDDALRPAFAAVVIVTLSSEPHVWRGSLDRVLGVTTGCLASLAVGLAFNWVSRAIAGPAKKSTNSIPGAE